MPDLKNTSFLLLFLLLSGCASIPIETQPAAIYKEGEEMYAEKRYDDAIAQYKKVREAYASTELSSNAELRIADSYFESERFIEASSAYEEFRKLHPTHQKAPYALYRTALSNYNQITGSDRDQTPQKNSVIYFELFLKMYPKSEFAADVADKLEAVKSQQLQYELYVADFYYRTDKFVAAIKRLEEVLLALPKNPQHDRTLFLLGASYLKSGETEKSRAAFNKLSTDFPNSKYILDAGKLLEKYY
jgi:outer membrane protein assembly factor BamD